MDPTSVEIYIIFHHTIIVYASLHVYAFTPLAELSCISFWDALSPLAELSCTVPIDKLHLKNTTNCERY
jgi:hypothetical protein